MIRAVQLQQLGAGQLAPNAGAPCHGPHLQRRGEPAGRIPATAVERGPVWKHLRCGIDHGIDHEGRGTDRRVNGVPAPREHEAVDRVRRHVGDESAGRIIASDGTKLGLRNVHAVHPAEIGLDRGR